MIIRKQLKFIPASLFMSLLVTVFYPQITSASITKNSVIKPICRIEIDNPHISRHELRFGSRRAVIVKAKSICNVIQEQVTLTVDLYKVERFGHPLLASTSTNPNDSTSNGKVVKNYKSTVDCKNFKRTKFYGIAYAKALINGQWNYAGRTRSIKTLEINCGT